MLPSNAQAQYSNSNLCPVDGYVSINSTITEGVIAEDELLVVFEMANDSSYMMAGFSVGVGVYSSPESQVPDFWTVLPEQVNISAKSNYSIPATLDISALPAGNYTVKVFVNQGDKTSVLGAAIRGGENNSFSLTKTSPQNSFTEMNITVNEELSRDKVVKLNPGQNLVVEVNTINKNNTPIIGGEIILSLNEGMVPLGGAVSKVVSNKTSLIPNTQKTTKLKDKLGPAGEYTAYAVLITDNTLQPIKKTEILVGAGGGKITWPYISLVAISDFPLQETSELIACVDYVGAYEGVLELVMPTGINFSTTNQEENTFKQVSNLGGGTEMFFKTVPGISATQLDLKVALLEDVYGKTTISGEEPEWVKGESDNFLTETQTVSISTDCLEGGLCKDGWEKPETVYVNSIQNEPESESFYFYIGVILVALLLMYLMLRRLPPEKIIEKDVFHKDYLQ
ncbi:MAG: hypothetical protein LR008_03440 [Candidatus Pacebacteria bacterium]|nr:hypothetical protein [Candidatus Paceibacterota bacterium]